MASVLEIAAHSVNNMFFFDFVILVISPFSF